MTADDPSFDVVEASSQPAAATFTITGRRPVVVQVVGAFDSSVGVGFLAVIDALIGEAEVVIDVSRCSMVDLGAAKVLTRGLDRITAAGGTVSIRSGQNAAQSSHSPSEGDAGPSSPPAP